MNRLFSAALAALMIFAASAGAARASDPTEYRMAERPLFSLGIGLDYETGDYGTGSDSDFVSVPLYIDFYPSERLDFELIIPYVYQSLEDGDVSTVVYRTSGGSAAGAVRGRRATATDSTTTTTTTTTTTKSRDTSESGLGDITLTAGYVLVEENSGTPQIRPTFYLKFPTADEDKGLGTGEFDFGPGLTVAKWLGDWHLFAEGVYVVQGDSDLYDSQDYFRYNGGLGYQLNDGLYGAVQAVGATAPADDADEALEGRLKLVWRPVADVAFEGYVGTGLSDGSADFTSSLAVFFDF